MTRQLNGLHSVCDDGQPSTVYDTQAVRRQRPNCIRDRFLGLSSLNLFNEILDLASAWLALVRPNSVTVFGLCALVLYYLAQMVFDRVFQDRGRAAGVVSLSLILYPEPTMPYQISYAVLCLQNNS